MDYLGMDRESLTLAIQLQNQDLNLWEQSKKGKERADEPTDSDIALKICRHELDAMVTLMSDHALGLSIARAVETDARVIKEATEAEEQAADDRDFAVRLSEDPNAEPLPAGAKHKKEQHVEAMDDAFMTALKSMNLLTRIEADDEIDETDSGQAESSAWASQRKESGDHGCLACGDKFPPLALHQSPCSHEYCRGCLLSLVNASLQDESLFPPRCCNNRIPIKPDRWFSQDLVDEFRAKDIEFNTVDRTYCSEPSCSAFLPPASITGEAAQCPKCKGLTCVHCKATYHAGVCRQDKASQQVLELAAENGWQQCRACQRIVELNFGCNHMICVCNAQFCYVCGVPWKHCDCPQWHEERLVRRANELVDRNEGRDRIDGRAREVRVGQERLNLIQNHECTHERWKGRAGPWQCEECLQVLPMFIYECRQCHIMACRRCRFNRLRR